MEIGKAFSCVTEDEQWITKVLIGGLIQFIPLLGTIATVGYSYRVAQNVARGSLRPLPAWGEFGDFLGRGFMGLIIGIVYLLPFFVLYGVFLFLTVAGAAVAEDSEAVAGVLGLLGLCLIPLQLVVVLVCGFASLAAIMRYLATDSLGEAFKFGEVIAILRNHIGSFLMILVVSILAGLVASLGVIACGVGTLFTGFYAQCVIGHVIGQAMQRIFPPQQPVYAAPGYYGPPPGYGPPPSY
ncbi:MAG: DUF4013 domain-containing protein [Roseiflexus sp.]|jgi:hypothetical protein|nr:DUF4013 domain-containing protein [Roseiflexus sp.]MBO9383003.1 DUF4013 domain-containing protein [Roseiflexus sp.]